LQPRLRFIIALAVALTMAFTSSAFAHPDHVGDGENSISHEEDFPGEGVEQEKQHDSDQGHLPPVQRNVRLIGKAEVTHPGGLSNDGRVGDVFAFENYAYLNGFRDPAPCANTGVHVIDISDPTRPFEVKEAFIPTTEGSYAGEGIKVIPIAGMDVLIHQNETCPGVVPAGPTGGISLWDVTDPTRPQPLARHQGDNTGPDGQDQGFVNDSHSFTVWTNVDTGKTYVAMIDNFENTDVDILDVTDPRNPVLINDTLDLVAQTQQAVPDTLTAVFSHDMDVRRFGSRDVMVVDYWDGGYVLLDVTDPTPEGVIFMGHSDYPLLDEERLARGTEIEPEGNAHQGELDPTGRFLLAADEDFTPFRVFASITSGPNRGYEFIAAQASDTPALTEENTPITGAPTFVGLACGPLPPGTGVALVERGVCTFQVKLDNIKAAGYSGGIVFNNVREDCLSLVTMLAQGDLPFIFVNREVGLKILNVEGVEGEAACETPTPENPQTAELNIEAVFDGWGYVRLFETRFAHDGTGGATFRQIDTFAVPESQDPAFALNSGDLSVHEIAMDPNPGSKLAYSSYYTAGFRVFEYDNTGIREVGAFIDEGGNNFWGVEVHHVNGRRVILASDRDFGLYIFDYTGHIGETVCNGSFGGVSTANVRVPDGATCTLFGTQVQGNVQVGRGATLTATAVNVNGNVQAPGATNVVLNGPSTIGGSVQLVGGETATITGNHISGNLQATGMRGAVSLADNTIDGNLQCAGNNTTPSGGNNQVGGSKQGQCAQL
jgi:hypothetical protein